MGTPAVTYNFSNGTTASAVEVNTNFSDLVNALTDTTSDHSISTLTLASTLTANGDVILGNAGTDSITLNGQFLSDIVPQTDETYDLGSTVKGWLQLNLARNSQYVTITPSGSASASYTLTLPVDAGLANQTLIQSGSATLAWRYENQYDVDEATLDSGPSPATVTISNAKTYWYDSVSGTTEASTKIVISALNEGQSITIALTESNDGDVTMSYDISAIGGTTLAWRTGTGPTTLTQNTTILFSFLRINNVIYGSALEDIS